MNYFVEVVEGSRKINFLNLYGIGLGVSEIVVKKIVTVFVFTLRMGYCGF